MIRTHTEVRFDDLNYVPNTLRISENRGNSHNSFGFLKKKIKEIINNKIEDISYEKKITDKVIARKIKILEKITKESLEEV